MIPTAYVSHQIAGRTRLRVPEKRGDGSYFERVRQTLSGDPAIERVKATPETASVLLHHAGSIAPIAAAAAEHGLFRIADQPMEPASQPVPVRTSAVSSLSPLDAGATGLSGLALLQAVRGQAFGSAIENFWNAYGARRLLQRSDLVVLFAAIGAYQALSGRYLGSASSLLFYSMVLRRIASSERETKPGRRAISEPRSEALGRRDPNRPAAVIVPRR